ncbi:MAG TPA: RtcB family protein [Planctomycetota bacterium]|nr:RtcB family protein [Planctomycetota bacterium]
MTVVHRWLAEPLPEAVAQALERLAAARGVQHVAVMPDVHLAEHVCVGVVVGTDEWLSPQAVGGDIGCGMSAVRIAAGSEALADEATAQRVFGELRRLVPTVRQPRPRGVDLGELSDPRLQRAVQRDVHIEFGTLGRGNHFLEVQACEQEQLWLMVHSGSRALGPAIAAHHLARGEPLGRGLVALAAGGAGREYLHDVQVALAFAQANRRAIAEAAALAIGEVIGAEPRWQTWFDVVHNHVRHEPHAGRGLWVHRKGACSAQEGEAGIIPGSMGSRSFHVEGRGRAESLCSSSHGAGRRLARGAACRAISSRDLERELRAVFFERHLAPHLRDEAPGAYKDIGAVMRAQRGLVRIVRTLRPVLAYKGV